MSTPAPDWDLEQLEVILADRDAWQLVEAGPGAGKSAVACQRIAYLVDDGVPPSRMLMVSFTRTAVAELRDRIISYAVADDRARSVRISTIDSHAWSLRVGFDDMPLPTLGEASYELSIQRTVELLNARDPRLCDFLAQLEHLVIDEAQDVIGVRGDLVIALLRSLPRSCGATILADPAQSIYGFTSDDTDGEKATDASLLDRLDAESPRPLQHRRLEQLHRVGNAQLAEVFLQTRKEIERGGSGNEHVARVQDVIRRTCGNDVGVRKHSSIAEFLADARDDDMLVLFRRRADVLFASSYCSQANVEHRIRMSDLPVVVRPWLGWLLGEVTQSHLRRPEYDALWAARGLIAPEPLAGEDRDACWNLLHRLAAARRPGSIDLVHLRRLVARTRPPIELCYPELGTRGPILGTIHASKGREADTVVLMMPSPQGGKGAGGSAAAEFEEGRVYYVGATRARQMLIAAGSKPTGVGYLDSRRVYRLLGEQRAQLELGRQGDVDPVAHLAWGDGLKVHQILAGAAGSARPLQARALPEEEFAMRLILELQGDDAVTRYQQVGQLSREAHRELRALWSKLDPNKELRPAFEIPHLYLAAVSTVGLSDSQMSGVRPPFNRSGFALCPVIKGFPTIAFRYRSKKRKEPPVE